MKKMLLVVAVLLMAVPAIATVSITVEKVTGSLMVDIGYDSTSEPNLVRAFALDVNVDNGAKIVDVNHWQTMVGESNSTHRGYGIFPGTIDINSTTFKVDSFGSPVAPVTDRGALGGLNTAGVTLEMGSLYKGDPNKPTKGPANLCRVRVDKICCLTVKTNATRGNVVLENVTEATTDLPKQVCFEAPCFNVPNLVGGCSMPDANAAIVTAGLTVGTITYAHSETVAAGCIISQNPTYPNCVPALTPVSYVVSLGPTCINIPNILNKTPTDANSTLVAAGLTGTRVLAYECNNTYAGDKVCRQNTGCVASDATIHYWVSKPHVPNIVGGCSMTDANTAIVAAKLKVGTITYAWSATVAKNCIISVTPNAGNCVEYGSNVNYVVSKGDFNCIPADRPLQRAAFAEYVSRGLDPSCWCAAPRGSGYQCLGDADGLTEGGPKYRVSQNDLNILILASNWNKKLTQNPNPCADIDHKTEGGPKYRVSQNDLNIMIAAANWNKKDTQLGRPGPCPKVD